MSLSLALHSAGSGLRAQSRAAELVSGNVANALTPGYARRELLLAADSVGNGGGVRVDGVARMVDPVILADRRVAEAGAGAAGVLADALKEIELAFGDPTRAGSLSDRVARLSARLVEATSGPESGIRLSEAVAAAVSLADGMNEVGRSIQEVRGRADASIAGLVERVNTAILQVDRLNDQILRLGERSRDASVLQEARQQAIDSIAEIVPLREVRRPNGEVALFTTNGAVLLDGRPQALGFQARGTVEPWMTRDGGALSGLTIGGVPVRVDGTRSLIGGGALQAQFTLRDGAGPEAQAALDALARDLVERFQDPTLDPTVPAGPPAGPGLFTDGTGAFDAGVPNAEEGLAQRLGVNTALDPASGGEAWRLRDGLSAAVRGPSGDPSLLIALAERLDTPRPPASGPQAGQARSFSAQVSHALSAVSATRLVREADAAFEGARLAGFREAEAANGVDTDDEMQKLLVIEQAYAANARVVRAVDAMMDRLMEI